MNVQPKLEDHQLTLWDYCARQPQNHVCGHVRDAITTYVNDTCAGIHLPQPTLYHTDFEPFWQAYRKVIDANAVAEAMTSYAIGIGQAVDAYSVLTTWTHYESDWAALQSDWLAVTTDLSDIVLTVCQNTGLGRSFERTTTGPTAQSAGGTIYKTAR